MKDKYYYKDETSSNTRDYTKVLHRTDGPAIEYADGVKSWYIDDKSHRTDGPAIEYTNGDKSWYIDGKRHRIDGPAIEYVNGYKRWCVDGEEYYSEEEFNELMEEAKQLPLALRLIDPREWVRKL